MAKDPAFLFYSKDWIEGTAEMLPAEKGVYIDLLCHQHQKGSLPGDVDRLCRIAGIGLAEFNIIWGGIKDKFIEVEPGRIANRKLTAVMTERSAIGHQNTILGKFAQLCRTIDVSKKDYLRIKSMFKIKEFLPLSTEEATKRLTERFTEWCQNIAIGNENGDAIETEIDTKKGVPKKPKEFIPPTLEEFTAYFLENKFPKELAERAWKGYSEADWKDSKGTPVRNWKAKCQHVWFSEANRSTGATFDPKNAKPEVTLPANILDR